MDEQRIVLDHYQARLLVLERCSLLTARTYVTEIRRFLRWMKDERLSWESVDARDLSRYLDARKTVDGIDSRSVSKAISALRSFFNYALDEGVRNNNPAGLLESPKRFQRLPEVISKEDVEKILDAVDISTPWGLRDRALFEFIYSAGLRVSEAVTVDIFDLIKKERLVRVKGKGNKERLVPYGDEAAHWLGEYLSRARPRLEGGRTSRALFIGRSGKRLSRKGIWKNYAAAAHKADMGSKLHTLRHSYATELLAGGADLRSVQELLGHADLGTTQIYTHVTDSFLEESHRRFLPKLKDIKNES